jgi:hypothetical protein
MIGKLLLSTLPFALALPAAAQAQGDDAAYCAQLSVLYLRYLGGTGLGNRFPDLTAAWAISDCQRGDTAAGIPVLEQKLRDGGFTLPKRDQRAYRSLGIVSSLGARHSSGASYLPDREPPARS